MKPTDGDDTERTEISTLFTTTHWSVVLRAKDNSFTALNALFNKYRDPMVRFFEKRGRTSEQAEDLVQGFCANLLRLDRKHFLSNVSPQKGKFRTFLLNSLENYSRDEIDKGKTEKRGKGIIPASLDEVDPDNEPIHTPASSALPADLEFDRDWAQSIIRNSLNKLEENYAHRKQATLFYELEPTLHEDETSPSLREIAERLGMTEGAVKVAALRMRKKLQEIIRDELMQTVSNEVEFNEELSYLLSLFGKTQF